ncbi:ABC transporter substrate-binding protein [soil metagenome]
MWVDAVRRGPLAGTRAGVVVGALLLTTLLLAGCTAAPVPTPTPPPTPAPTVTPTGDGTLRIGSLLPTSGALAFLGPATNAGIALAIADINEAGGVEGRPVELLARDSGDATTADAETAFDELVSAGADAVVGPASSVLAERVLPAAAAAGVPLVSPAATYPQLTDDDVDGWFSRTVPPYGHQAAAVAQSLDKASADRVVLIVADDPVAGSIVAPLATALEAHGGELAARITVDAATGVAAVVAQAVATAPDAVVLATLDNGAQTQALISGLTAAGLGGARLWLTSQNVADYSQALPAGLLAGVTGVIEGAMPDAAFAARVRQLDPALSDVRYAAESYDATVLIALAATIAHDDGAASIAATLRAASAGGIKCADFEECLDVLAVGDEPDYDGVSGAVDLDGMGDPVTAYYGVYSYDASNKFALVGGVTA